MYDLVLYVVKTRGVYLALLPGVNARTAEDRGFPQERTPATKVAGAMTQH